MAGASERKRLTAQRELLSQLCRRISPDVEPDQMAHTSEREQEAGDRGIKTRSWRATRTRARHRPALSKVMIA